MIAIKVDGEWLDLHGVKIRIKATSQVFDRSFVQNWFSYPVALPRTATNAIAMRHYDRVANTADIDDIPCEIHLGGIFWKSAFIAFRGYRDNKYDVDLKVPPDAVITTLSERRLSSFDFGGPYSFEHTPDTDLDVFNDFFTDRLGSIDDTPFIFAPIRNENKFDGTTETYFGVEVGVAPNDDIAPPHNYLNYYDPNLTEEFFYYDAGAPPLDFWFQDFTPLPYLAYVVEHIFETLGIQLQGDVFDDPEVRTQVVVSNAYMMLLVVTDGMFTVNDTYNSLELGTCLPDITCVELLSRLMKRYNAIPVWSGTNTFTFKSLRSILASADYFDITDRTEPDIELLVDNTTPLIFTSEMDPLDQLLDENKDFDRDRLIGTVDTFGDLGTLSPEPGDFALVLNERKVYVYRQDLTGLAWYFNSDYVYDLTENGAEQEESIGVVMTAMYLGEDEVNGSRDWLVPEVAAPISDHMGNINNVGIRDMTELRLLFYRGMQPDSNADNYPLLSTGTLDFNGDAITDAEMCESIEGDGGIYDHWYSAWRAAIVNARRGRARVRLTLDQVRTFDFGRKLRINSTTWLPISIDLEVNQSGYGPALVEMLSLQPDFS